MAQEDVFRLQIAVNHLMLLQEIQRAQELLSEAPDKLQREASERIRLDEFIEIHVEQLGRDAEMSTEVETLSEVDHTVFVLGILVTILARWSLIHTQASSTHPVAKLLQDVNLH